MKPILLKFYPYLGVAARGQIKKDTDFNPFENAEILGRLLAEP